MAPFTKNTEATQCYFLSGSSNFHFFITISSSAYLYSNRVNVCATGHEDMVALLLSQGANINAQTEETQETALTLACCGGFLEVADFLLKAGADLEAGASTPLMEAAQEGHLDLVRYLLEYHHAQVNAQTQTGDTALTYACENGHTDVASLLLLYGADLVSFRRVEFSKLRYDLLSMSSKTTL